MKKFAILLIALFAFTAKSESQIYMADSCRVSFFSATSMEDIYAVNTLSKPIMSATTGDIQINISNRDFVFQSRLMGDHFNKDYMETDKYPHTTFKGKVNEQIDYAKDGINQVTVTGTMDMHGVQKTITIPGTITIQNGTIFLLAKFNVKMVDYNINIPSILGDKLTDHVAVTLTATMKLYNAK